MAEGISFITRPATAEQLKRMATRYEGFIKVAVDIEREYLAGGGKWHADCAQVLQQHGSRAQDVWGAGYDIATGEVDFKSHINIRPDQGNTGQEIDSPILQRQVETIIRRLFEP